ncbi:hypothetical protein [Thermostichus vulcanus]|uniref:Type II secretion system protein GspE N-terminal domain-containing protein n=1 Tax=Thermostichus vulcanus str. 'Rupite' TaxID=2813851 RepID=A0ABT0CCP6_THEVL|nr:hypothetical protein [Thermostichus vulcanus]MCJ2543100.1 hypothetical protein [Thermostichus vulcanus str. 'Rupite']
MTFPSGPPSVTQKPSAQLIGQVLLQAGLLTEAQVQVALQDQSYCGVRFGEILVTRGWIKQETVDFLVDQWPELLQRRDKMPLGECLQAAGLLTPFQVEQAVREQRINGMRIGAVIVLNGWLKKNTVDFFLQGLAPNRVTESPFITKPRTTGHPLSKPTSNTVKSQGEELVDEDIDLEDLN